MSESLDLRLVLDGFSDAVVVANEQNEITYVNAAAERLLGWPKTELVGRPLTTIMPARMQSAHLAGFRRYLKTRVPTITGKPIRVPALRRDGEEIEIELTLSNFQLGDGRILFVGSLRDLRDRVELERQIVAQQRILAQYGVMVAIAEAKTLEEAGEKILRELGEALGWPVGLLWTVDRAKQHVGVAAAWAATPESAAFVEASRQCVFRIGEGAVGKALETRKTMTVRIESGLTEPYHRSAVAAAHGLRTALLFPITCANQLHGVLEFLCRGSKDPDVDLVRTMETVGFQIGQFLERLRGEEQLRESEEWLSTTLTGIGDAIIATDADGRVRFLNPVAAKLIGWAQSEAQGNPLADVFRIVSEETRQPIESPVDTVIRERHAVGLTNHNLLISKDGSERVIEDSGAPILARNGDFRGVVLCFRDATARRRAERERLDLLKRERYAREEAERERGQAVTVANAVPHMLWISSPAGTIEFYNQRWYEYSGIAPGEVDPEAWRRIVHPDDLEALLERAKQGIESGEPYELEARLLRASDQSYRWHLSRVTPVRDARGRIAKWVGSSTDIDDRKTAEANTRFLADASALVSASLDYKQTLNSLADLAVPRLADWCAISLVDPEKQTSTQVVVKHTDPAKATWAEELARRYPPDPRAPRGSAEVIRTGKAALYTDIADDLLVASARDAEHLELLRTLGMRSAMVVPLRVRGRAIGAITFVSAESRRRYDAMDLPIAQELADRAGHAVDNARLYDDAREAIRVRDDFLSIASHELKTPLTPLQLHLQAIQRNARGAGPGFTSERIATKIDTMARQVNRLERLVNNLLDISRIMGQRLQIEREDVNLTVVVREVAARFDDELQRAGCALMISAPDELCGSWDRLRLDQITSNLLGNAIKFGAGMPIEVSIRADDGWARLTVTDHGIGIAEEDQARIFERFERAVQSKHFGGFGLGLWIVRQIVEALGGTIQLNSVVGQGATFIVELPRARADQIIEGESTVLRH